MDWHILMIIMIRGDTQGYHDNITYETIVPTASILLPPPWQPQRLLAICNNCNSFVNRLVPSCLRQGSCRNRQHDHWLCRTASQCLCKGSCADVVITSVLGRYIIILPLTLCTFAMPSSRHTYETRGWSRSCLVLAVVSAPLVRLHTIMQHGKHLHSLRKMHLS